MDRDWKRSFPKSGEGSLWRPFLKRVAEFEYAHFYFIDAHFPDPTLETPVGFSGVAKLEDGRWRSVAAEQILRWDRDGESWHVSALHQRKFETKTAPRRRFREVLDEAIPHADTLARARQSIHEENIVSHFTDGRVTLPKPLHVNYPSIDSLFQHPPMIRPC